MPGSKSKPPRGQHFLADQGILCRIADALEFARGDSVVEIGAGAGALTAHLLERGARVTAIEVDARWAAHLRATFGSKSNLEMIEADVLEVDLPRLLAERGPRVWLAGNLPYYITSPILRHYFEARNHAVRAVFLMQKEVAERVVAKKNSRDYGLLSALAQLHSVPEYLFSVPPGAFRPPPKVTSAAVRFIPRLEGVDGRFLRFLESCFRQPRKMLLNNLAVRYDRSVLAADPQSRLRAQQLDLGELHALWTRLEAADEPASAT